MNKTAQIEQLRRENATARITLTVLSLASAFVFLVIIKFSFFTLFMSILLAASLAVMGFLHIRKNNKLIKQLEKETNADIFVDVR
jgi:hypothetical protein